MTTKLPESERSNLENAIAAQEKLRGIVDDNIIETTIGALRKQLTAVTFAKKVQERKQATILFADVLGFTEMSAELDAEKVTEVMNEMWHILDATITDFDGYIDKHIGDEVMAIWGARIAREDDPEQAIRAALAMQSKLAHFRGQRGIDLWIRIGINTGTVLLGVVGSTAEYTAIGDAVNTASRLEEAAPVNGILISYDTYQHVQGMFEFQSLEEIQVKGKAEPLRVYSVLRAKPRAFRMGRRGIEGIETRIVGRETELQILQDATNSIIRDEKSQFITVVGEAGVGKSRLLFEFEKRLDSLSRPPRIYQGRARLETQSLPYGLLRYILGLHFDIQEDDPPQIAREKIVAGICNILSRPLHNVAVSSEMKAHFIGHLLGYDFQESPHLAGSLNDPRQIQDRALLYLAEYFRAGEEDVAVIILLEDIHWADESSLDALAHLVHVLRDQRLIIIALARPDLLERRPQWKATTPSFRLLPIKPLSREDSRLLVEEVLQKVKDIPEALRELVVGSTEGNPFYIEELVKMLIEDDVIFAGDRRWQVRSERLIQVRVPPTLAGVLQARLESLPPAERAILQQASAIGRVFWDSAIIHMNKDAGIKLDADGVKRCLLALRDREIVFQRETAAFAGTTEFIFKHSLQQKAAYESVLLRMRRVYHAAIAEWFIQRSGGRIGEINGLVADHLLHAGDHKNALAYLRWAGDRAAEAYANEEAAAYYSRALNLIPEDKPTARFDLVAAREKVNELEGNREAQAQDLEILGKLAELIDEPAIKAETAERRSHYAFYISNYSLAGAHAEKALEEARLASDETLQAKAYLALGRTLWQQGKYANARKRLIKALTLAQSLSNTDITAKGMLQLGNVDYTEGNYIGAHDHYLDAQQLYHEIGARRSEGGALNNLGVIAALMGDYSAAKIHFRESLHVAQDIGDRRGQAKALSNLGQVAGQQGDYNSSVLYLEQGLEIAREIANRQGEGNTLSNLGSMVRLQGDLQKAIAYSQEALELARDIGDKANEGEALTTIGHIYLDSERWIEALSAYEQAISIRRELGQSIFVTEALAGQARVKLAQNEIGAALILVKEILAFLNEGGTVEGADEPLNIYLTCYRVLQAAKDPRAVATLFTAYSLLDDWAKRISNESFRQMFLAQVPWHKEINELWQALNDSA